MLSCWIYLFNEYNSKSERVERRTVPCLEAGPNDRTFESHGGTINGPTVGSSGQAECSAFAIK